MKKTKRQKKIKYTILIAFFWRTKWDQKNSNKLWSTNFWCARAHLIIIKFIVIIITFLILNSWRENPEINFFWSIYTNIIKLYFTTYRLFYYWNFFRHKTISGLFKKKHFNLNLFLLNRCLNKELYWIKNTFKSKNH